VDEFALDDERARADDARRRVEDREEEVLVVVLGEPFVACVPILRGRGGLASCSFSGSVVRGVCYPGSARKRNPTRRKKGLTSSVTSPTVVSTLNTSRNPF
jgi:hypothetical protein